MKKQGLSKIFADSFKEYKLGFWDYAKIIFLLSFVPAIIFAFVNIVAQNQYPTVFTEFNESSGITFEESFSGYFQPGAINFTVALIVLAILGLILSIILFATLTYKSLNPKKKSKESLKNGMKYAGAYFWMLVLQFLVLGLFAIGAFSFFGYLSSLLANPAINATSIIFLILFLIISIVSLIFGAAATIYWMFNNYFLIDKNTGILKSFSESYRLVKKRWWLTLSYFLLFVGIIIVFFIIFMIPTFIIGVLTALPDALGAQITMTLSLIFAFIEEVLSYVANLFIMPAGYIFFKNLYVEYKKTKPKK
ncbi:hypothetical protein GOV14_01075 [Candidatus Pacearchaeota archaeon]|nr:hypothetical protein [Candidatus Pacearchaeota archaeon]